MSTSDQETRLQADALLAAGVQRIYEEKGSGIGPRPELHRALASLQAGDVLVVWKLDRFARSVRHLWEVLDSIRAAGAGFRSLTEPVDTSSALGEFVLSVLGSVAQFERALIRERAIAGQVAAYRRGIRWGGQPRVLTDDDAAELVRLRATGLFTIPMLADIFGCSESTVWRYLWLAHKPDAAKLRTRGLPVLGAYLSGS